MELVSGPCHQVFSGSSNSASPISFTIQASPNKYPGNGPFTQTHFVSVKLALNFVYPASGDRYLTPSIVSRKSRVLKLSYLATYVYVCIISCFHERNLGVRQNIWKMNAAVLDELRGLMLKVRRVKLLRLSKAPWILLESVRSRRRL